MLTNEQIMQIDRMDMNDRWSLAIYSPDADILEYLSNYEEYGTRYYVARNEHTPIDVLVKLSNDEYYDVCRMAIEQLNKRKYESKCINLNKHTTKGILE